MFIHIFCLLTQLKECCNFLMNKLNVFLKRRKEDEQLVNLEQVNEIMKTLDIQVSQFVCKIVSAMMYRLLIDFLRRVIVKNNLPNVQLLNLSCWLGCRWNSQCSLGY